jgi:uncharacterized phage protein (TIGR02220 family)
MKCPACGFKMEAGRAETDGIILYLNDVTGKNFRYIESNRKIIRARLNDGYTEKDLMTVIEKKARDWMGTEHEKYLRPETLFGPKKIEGYLNQPDRPNSGNSKTDTGLGLVQRFREEES